jgi:GDP-L-fucose synthase
LDRAVNRTSNLYISLSDFIHKNRLCIPFYDRNKKVVFYQSRSLDNTNPKYLGKSGYEKTIFEYAKFIADYFKLRVNFKFDKSIPDGTSRKVLDSSIARKYGWYPKVDLKKGLSLAYNDFIKRTKVF